MKMHSKFCKSMTEFEIFQPKIMLQSFIHLERLDTTEYRLTLKISNITWLHPSQNELYENFQFCSCNILDQTIFQKHWFSSNYVERWVMSNWLKWWMPNFMKLCVSQTQKIGPIPLFNYLRQCNALDGKWVFWGEKI